MTWQPSQYDPAQHAQRLQPYPQPPYSPQGPPPPGIAGPPYARQPPPVRKRRRVFMWVFLAVQVLFIAWIIAGVHGNASGQGAQVHAQAVSFCSNGGWKFLYPSYARCVASYGNTLNSASDDGTALGVGLIIALWAAVDIIMGVCFAVVRLSRRRP